MSSSNSGSTGAGRGRGRGRGGSVRGPTSALTSFLQEQGISARAIAQSHRRRQEEAAAAASSTAAPGIAANGNTEDSEATAQESASLESLQVTDAMDVDSDEEDAQEDLVVSVRLTRSRRGATGSASSSSSTSISTAEQAAGSSSNSSKAKRKLRKRKPDTSSDDDDFVGSGTGRNAQPQRPESSICIKCRRTITKFTKSAYASVCRSCAGIDANDATSAARAPLRSTRRTAASSSVDSGDAASVPAIPKRRIGRARETAAEYALVRDDQDLALAQTQVPSLQDMCIKALVDLIDHVEDLGDLSAGSLRKLARVLCKKRRLDAGILPLFTGPFITSLTLYDVTSLDAEVLGRLSFLCPQLRVLHLAFCGRANDETIDAWVGAGWDGLCEVTLKGPYLVTDGAWARFFVAYGGQLTKLNLEYCAKLAEPGVRALVEAQEAANNPLEDLAFHYADSLSSHALDLLTNLVNLQGLSLMYSCSHLTDLHIEAFTRCMPQLRAIAIGVASHLTDKSLFALRRVQGTLVHLTLSSVDGITTAGVHSWLRGVWPPVRGRIVGDGEENGGDDEQAEQQQGEVQAQEGAIAAASSGSAHTADTAINGDSAQASAAAADGTLSDADPMEVDGQEDEDPLFALPTMTAEEALEWQEHDTLPPEIDFSDLLATSPHVTFPTLRLETLVLDRCRGINSDAALVPILEQTAPFLKHLALNWMDQVTHRSLMALIDSVGPHPVVRDLDLSWVRCVDDPVLEQLVKRLPELARVAVFGCNKLTAWATVLKQWENARGERVVVVGSEFSEA